MKRVKRIFDFVFCKPFEKFFAAWLFSAAIIMAAYTDTISLDNINITNFIILFFAAFILIACIEKRFSGAVYPILVFSVLIFSMILLVLSNNIYTFSALAVFFLLSVNHYFNKKEKLNTNLSKTTTTVIIIWTAVFFFAVVTAISVFRYMTYTAPNYDFGIFCNMFHNMRESFKPLVSCERDKILSHFAVHFSPAMYVFLPVYFIFPSPVTVAVCQTVAIYSGLIPFILIMKHKNFEPLIMCLFSVVFMANAAFSGGCLFDFHENCLLVPFLMWMFYFYEKNKLPFVFLFALFTLMVKEDAFIYISVFAVYIFITKREYVKGAALLIFAVAYFAAAYYYLEQHGTGIMAYRFNSMIGDDEGLLGIIKTVLTNPAYTVKQIFNTTDNNPQKLIYFMQILCPLAFIPFFTKVPSRLILILPILLNLLTDYSYQYDISFQYGFGITSLLLYLCILNVGDMKKKKRDFVSVCAAGLAVMMFFMIILPEFTSESKKFIEDREIIEEMNEVIEKIPDDVSVAASTFLIPHLSDRTEIYEAYYTTQTDFEYLVLDMRPGYRTNSEKIATDFEKYGYEPYDLTSEYIYIYKKAK